ncbi:thiol-disulfide isomerase/thioredoxin [Pedobacter sp. UYEF25]
MMKKIALFGVMAMLCALIANAQSTPTLSNLRPGDKLPDAFWTQSYTVYQNGKFSQQTLAPYKNKLLILDFWASWCGPCLQKFPMADSLQLVYPNALFVLGVNALNTRDTPEIIKAVLVEKSPNRVTIASDTLLTKLFRHAVVPHYVWIEDGQWRATTSGEFFTPANVAACLERRSALNEIIRKRKENIK